MFRQTALKSATAALLLGAGMAYGLTAGYFGRELLTEVAILAILAISLDLVAGYGGMVSLAHGALFGAGAYVFAAVTLLAGQGAPFGMLAAVLATAAFAWAIGAVTARTRGIFFIMATLAFGQMAYVWVFESRLLGGDDGMFGIPRLDLSAIGIDLSDSRTFALAAVALTALAYAAAAWVLTSGFGRTLVGIRANEGRMRALGLAVWRHKANAFGLSGALAGLAGAMAAQHTQFISPGLLHWTVSGEALVVVILGGLGTLIGPVLGAAVFVFLKHEIQGHTDYWHLFVGAVLIAVVVSGGRGIYGTLEDRLARRRAARHA
jgi:branched-chain amino acid transport system permease protein